jgi:dolichol-phosphate mannosyltransferase
MSPPLSLSVVVPCYNEAGVLDALHARLTAVCRGLRIGYEIVLVNDGSQDRTWEVMTRLAARDPNLVCVNLSRNHGHQLALTAGLAECRGRRILVIDADLQDPPELLPDMLEVMDRERADVVYGKRVSRQGETWFKRATAAAFYRLLGWFSDTPLPRDTGDFRLMSARVREAFLAMPERHRYVRGMISWIGYRQVAFTYERHPRAAGETHYTLRKMVRFAWDAVTGFSVKPLTLPMRAAGVCLAAAAAVGIGAGWWWLARSEIPGIGLLAGLNLLLAAGQFAALGISGEYLGRMYSEVRGRPLFLIDDVIRTEASADRHRREAA